jgi:hypothetical protein
VWLIVVSAAYLLIQIILLDERRFLEWDEAIYVGKASSRLASPGWGPHRSLGIVWLVRPVLVLSDSFVLMRLYLAGVSAVILGLAFSRWIRPAKWLAPLGMAVFASGWLPIFYGSEVSPNLFVAATAVGAAGSLLAYVLDGRRSDLIIMSLFLGAAVVLRPSDGFVLAVGLGISAFLMLRTVRVLHVAAAVIGGFVLGAIPWAVEAFERFGDPVARLGAASKIVGGGPTLNVLEQLRLQDGPLIGPDRVLSVSMAVLALLVGSALLVGFGVFDRDLSPAPKVAFGLGMLISLPYFFYVDALAPRFLLPALALVSIATAAGVLHLWRLRTSMGVVAVAILLIATMWSFTTVAAIATDQLDQRRESHQIASAIADLGDEDSCVFLSQYGFPQIMLGSGCPGQRADLASLSCQVNATQLRLPDTDVLVVLVSQLPDDLGGSALLLEGADLPSGWSMYFVPAGTSVSCGEN